MTNEQIKAGIYQNTREGVLSVLRGEQKEYEGVCPNGTFQDINRELQKSDEFSYLKYHGFENNIPYAWSHTLKHKDQWFYVECNNPSARIWFKLEEEIE